MQQTTAPARTTNGGDKRALRILAKSVYRELKANGYSHADIVGFTNALLEHVTTEIKGEDADEPAAS